MAELLCETMDCRLLLDPETTSVINRKCPRKNYELLRDKLAMMIERRAVWT